MQRTIKTIEFAIRTAVNELILIIETKEGDKLRAEVNVDILKRLIVSAKRLIDEKERPNSIKAN